MQGCAVDAEVSGDGLNRGALGVLVECNSIALELLEIGLAWHGGRLHFPASYWSEGVYHLGAGPSYLE